MKLGNTVLAEIVDIVRSAIIGASDASENLRAIDLEEKDGVLELTEEYLKLKGRK